MYDGRIVRELKVTSSPRPTSSPAPFRPGAGTASVHESEQHGIPAIATLHNTRDERSLCSVD
jgi:hypothetical protein